MAVAAVLRDAWRSAGLSGRGPGGGPGVRACPRSARGRRRHRDQPRGRHDRDDRRDGGRQGRGRTDGVDHGQRGARRRASGADVVLATVEMDRSWCHTVGYVSPIVAAAVVAAALDGRAMPDGCARRAASGDGIEAAHAADADGSRPDAAIAATVRRRAISCSSRDGRGSDHRPRARARRSRRRRGCRRRSATSRRSSTATCRRPGPQTAVLLVLTERAGLAARAKRARQALAAVGGAGHPAGRDPGRRRGRADPRGADARRADRGPGGDRICRRRSRPCSVRPGRSSSSRSRSPPPGAPTPT